MRITLERQAMATPNDLIELDDLEDLGLDVSTEQARTTASAWITYVSNYLRLIARNNGINLDAKLLADRASGGAYTSVVKMVVANAVMRANATDPQMPDVTQFSQSASPYSESFSINSAIKDAYFKNKELELLGFSSISGNPQITVMRGVRG